MLLRAMFMLLLRDFWGTLVHDGDDVAFFLFYLRMTCWHVMLVGFFFKVFFVDKERGREGCWILWFEGLGLGWWECE